MNKEKSGEEMVEYVAARRDDGTLYTLTVSCPEGLTEKEFADAIVAFAHDVYSGDFTFENESVAAIVSTQ